MLKEFLAKHDLVQQRVIVDALSTLDEFELFDFILRQELIYLANAVTPEEAPAKIHERIIAYQAKQTFVTQLRDAIPKGD